MADWKKRKRVRAMRRVLREHGSPVPKRKGCSLVLAYYFMFGVAIGLLVLGAVFMRRP